MIKRKGENSLIARQRNRGLILKLIATDWCTSRIELSRETNLTKMSITNIVSELMGLNLVVESEEEKTDVCGRNPIKLQISQKAPKVIGVLIFRDFCEVVLCDLKLKIMKRERVQLLALTEKRLLENVFKLIDGILSYEDNILGIGVASIGPVDINNGIILNPPNFFGIENVAIVSILKEKYKYPIFFDHDNNSAALAEALYGAGKIDHDFVFVGISNGIGSGVVIDGEVFRNQHGYAPEIGHVSIDRHGKMCICGNRGCLETYASATIVESKLRKLTGKELSFSDFCELTNNKEVNEVFLEMIDDISFALTSCINILQPESIIIGQACANIDEKYLKLLEHKINQRKLIKDQKTVKVKRAFFGEDAQLVGAASNVIVQAFKGNLLF